MADYHPQDTQTEEYPVFLRKRPKEQASRLILLEVMEVLLGNRLVDPIFVLLALLQLSESSLGPYLVPSFVQLLLGDISMWPGSGGQQGLCSKVS